MFKLEHKVKIGYSISGKTHCIINKNNKTIIRAKGVNSNSLNEDDFIKMLKGGHVDTTIKTTSIKSY